MNRLGMMVDISHVSDKTFWDVIETTTPPSSPRTPPPAPSPTRPAT